jgi:hypothetical protein
MTRTTRGWAALAAVVTATMVVVGCGGGSGEGLDSNGRPLGEGNDPSGPMTASFSSIQSHVFTPVCTGCHAGAAAPQGLRLDATNSYALLVGVSSSEVPGLKRVAPGDADNSYLIHKLEGHQAVGARMPFGGPYLDAASINLIRQWINNGAQK